MKKSIARVLADTIRNNYKVLVPLIHFLLSFMWERFAFTYSDVWIYFNITRSSDLWVYEHKKTLPIN